MNKYFSRAKIYPSVWKNANVTPLYKKGDASLLNNYRPISILSAVSKVMEKAIFKHTFNFIRDNNLLHTLQSGFMPGHSTTHQLVHLYHVFSQALDNKQKGRLVFGDISKAFDRVWHAGVIHKLNNFGITGELNSWFSSYLSERKQRVVLDGFTSSYGGLQAGVPQGSVLGPLLFLIFINDIKYSLESTLSLYADDSLFCKFSNNIHTCNLALNRDLCRIDSWSKQWQVMFSAEKTCDMVLSLRPSSDPPNPLTFSGSHLKSVSTHKHLGVTFSSDLKWNIHVNDICIRAEQRICNMYSLSFKLNRKTLETLYFSFIRPILEYADVLLTNLTENDSLKIEKVQKRAGKIVSGAIKGTSYDVIINELGWEPLNVRRNRRQLLFFSDIVHKHTPSYLCDDLPPSVQTRTDNRYQLRNNANLTNYRPRTETLRNSFFPFTLNTGNTTDEAIRLIDNHNILLSKIKHPIPKKKPHFYKFSRKVNIIMSRLRMNCSELKYHLYINHVSETPNCLCGCIETPQHYFLECPLYLTHRDILLAYFRNTEAPLSLKNILYGDIQENMTKTLIAAVEQYICETQRFSILSLCE